MMRVFGRYEKFVYCLPDPGQYGAVVATIVAPKKDSSTTSYNRLAEAPLTTIPMSHLLKTNV